MRKVTACPFAGIDYADDNGCILIIALDCGIKSWIKWLMPKRKALILLFAITTAQAIPYPMPLRYSAPKRDDCSYPYDELCRFRCNFKLIQALAANRNQTIMDLLPWLDLVATAIAADIVPITGSANVWRNLGSMLLPIPHRCEITTSYTERETTTTYHKRRSVYHSPAH
jgi:single-stranded-DNA-specific exonuclease